MIWLLKFNPLSKVSSRVVQDAPPSVVLLRVLLQVVRFNKGMSGDSPPDIQPTEEDMKDTETGMALKPQSYSAQLLPPSLLICWIIKQR